MKEIILTTINAKWIHPSLALRLLKANLGALEDSCKIMEFALRQPLKEKLEPLLTAAANKEGGIRILAFSVSIWNHLATIELLEELEKAWVGHGYKPVIVLGGPEVSHLPEDAEIFKYADYVIRGEGETAFRLLCEDIFAGRQRPDKFIIAENVDLTKIKTAYHLYTDEDVTRKLIYVEASRGCVFNCEFCLSAVKTENSEQRIESRVREFPLEPFLAEMDILIQRGVKTFKYLDRSININIKRFLQIIEFFLEKIESSSPSPSPPSAPPPNLRFEVCEMSSPDIVVHFEMVPSIFPPELIQALSRFPPGTLRLEIGIQTLNPEVAARIGRLGRQNQPVNPQKEMETLGLLREKTNAIIHADLIAGLPGEDLNSFGKGFDRLLHVLWKNCGKSDNPPEIQLGILKLLPGAPISRHNETFKMRYNPLPPYEIEETSAMSTHDIQRIKNFARFWELIVIRTDVFKNKDILTFNNFLSLSDLLFAYFGRNFGIDKAELLKKTYDILNQS